MAKNDFAVLVVDVSAENRRFEETRDMAADFVLRKLVHHSTKSQICLILLGTRGEPFTLVFVDKLQGGEKERAPPHPTPSPEMLRFSVASRVVAGRHQ